MVKPLLYRRLSIRTNSSYPQHPQGYGPHWEYPLRCRSPDYYYEPLKTPASGKYITIQPRNPEDNPRDHRMLSHLINLGSLMAVCPLPKNGREITVTANRDLNDAYGVKKVKERYF